MVIRRLEGILVEAFPANWFGASAGTAAPAARRGPLESFGVVRRYRIGEIVYLCNEPVEFWYQLLSGSGRRYAMTYDGRRQIIEFLLPGDLFGFGGAANRHLFSVEAIASDTSIAAYPRRHLERLLDSEPGVGRCVREMVLASVSRIQARVVTLGRTSALARVSAFLLEVAERFPSGPASAIILPMSRYDIADYLCVAVETVSRALTELRARGVVRFGDIRSVQICDRDVLEALSEGSPDEKPRARMAPRKNARGGVRRSGTAHLSRKARLGFVITHNNSRPTVSRSV